MKRRGAALLAAPFQGRWRIVEMDLWDNEAINLSGTAPLSLLYGETLPTMLTLSEEKRSRPTSHFSSLLIHHAIKTAPATYRDIAHLKDVET